jgi:hypothetical protein
MKAFWKKICSIFVTKRNDMSNKEQTAKVHATESGSLYIKETDFFRQEKVGATLTSIMNSAIYKKIRASKEGRVIVVKKRKG